MDSRTAMRLTQKHSAHNYDPYPFVVDRAEGPWLYDPEGGRALDLLAGYSAILSHNWPVAREARDRAEADLVSRALYSTHYAEFLDKITSFTGYDRVLPKSNGSSVTESALKALRRHGHQRGIRRPEIILITNYFHGRASPFATNATFDADQSFGMGLPSKDIVVVAHNAGAVERAINKNTIGIMMEIHRGEAGPLFDEDGTYPAIHRIAREHDLFVVVDEIQTGLYRCGYIMAWQAFGPEYRPDAVTLGKSLGGGIVPIAVLLGTEEFMSVFTPGSEGETYGGFPPACAVASAVIDFFRDHPQGERSIEIGRRFSDDLQGIPHVGVKCRGALIDISVRGVRSTRPICIEMLTGEHDPHVFVKHGHGRHIRVSPPILAITDELIDEACEKTIRPVLEKASAMITRSPRLPIDLCF